MNISDIIKYFTWNHIFLNFDILKSSEINIFEHKSLFKPYDQF